jgi:hypothetical protein
MNRRTLHLLLCCTVAAVVVSGCSSSWMLTPSSPSEKISRFNVVMNSPARWYKKENAAITLFTRNGYELEHIILQRKKWSDTLSNGLVMPSTVMLHQIPELLLGEYCAAGVAFNLHITSLSLTTLNTIPCAIAEYRYTSYNSLNKRGVLYCVPFNWYITILKFEAEATHYHEMSVNEFNALAKTFVPMRKKVRALPGIAERR